MPGKHVVRTHDYKCRRTVRIFRPGELLLPCAVLAYRHPVAEKQTTRKASGAHIAVKHSQLLILA